MITLTASSQVKTLRIELPARTVRLHGIELEPSMLAGSRYRNWTDGDLGVVAVRCVSNPMELADPTGRTP